MRINTLKLTTFRNIDSAKIEVGKAQIIALYGSNGAGKTSVLEALSLLSPGKGLNRNKLDSHIQTGIARAGTKMWGLHADIITSDDNHSIGMTYSSKKRQIKVDELTADSQAELSNIGNVLWFTPKMDRLFMDGAKGRREFLDRLVYGHNPNHAKNLALYKHHIRSRLKLLQTNSSVDWIEIEEEQAAKYAVMLGLARQQYLDDLKPFLTAVHLWQTGSFVRMMASHSQAEADGSNIDSENSNLDQSLEMEVTAHFKETRERDKILNSTLFGPQRSGIEGKFTATEISLSQSSTGQHKRAILEILLANARLIHSKTGHTPLILMDEMTAHLDEKIRNTIFASLTELGTQIWLTGTEKSLFKGLKGVKFIKVDSGNFS